MRAKVLFICLLLASGMFAQVREDIEKNKVYQGFSGGMMLHTGYLFGRDGNGTVIISAVISFVQSARRDVWYRRSAARASVEASAHGF